MASCLRYECWARSGSAGTLRVCWYASARTGRVMLAILASGWPAGQSSPFKILQRNTMNKDQVKGAVKEVAGQVQAQAGKVVGSREQQVKGHAREAVGKVQHVAGDARKLAKDATKKL